MDRSRGKKEVMRVASIDIGTNTILLLVADVVGGGSIRPVHHDQRLPRLGSDVDSTGVIGPGAFDRIAWILNEFRDTALQMGARHVTCAATSAVRDAGNRREFLDYVRTTTGLEIDVLTGDDEALWTFRGALSGFPDPPPADTVVDVGGGSTEITSRGDGGVERHSLQIGSVRLTERYLRHDPPEASEILAARQSVHAAAQSLTIRARRIIAVAGTATTLACLDQHLDEFDVEKVAGYRMRQETVSDWEGRLSALSSMQIAERSGTTRGREDILTAGVLILDEIMRRLGSEEMIVSERGLRYGLILRASERLGQQGRQADQTIT